MPGVPLTPDEMLTTTRSVRKRLDLTRPVPLQLVKECLEIALACRARGLGTAWTTLHLQYETEVAGLLGLPGDIRQGALIPTAYYTGYTFRPAARRPLADVLHVDHW